MLGIGLVILFEHVHHVFGQSLVGVLYTYLVLRLVMLKLLHWLNGFFFGLTAN